MTHLLNWFDSRETLYTIAREKRSMSHNYSMESADDVCVNLPPFSV
jgi:hypothetical protein